MFAIILANKTFQNETERAGTNPLLFLIVAYYYIFPGCITMITS